MSDRFPRRTALRIGGAAAVLAAGAVLSTPVPPSRIPVIGGEDRVPAGTPRDAGRLDWGPDAQRQTGWLLVPDSSAWGGGSQRPAYPVVVMIHGGGWDDASDPGYMADLAWDLASRGVAVWAPTYRGISGPGGWPETFQDVSDAIDFVPQLGEAGGFEPDRQRVHLLGHSAGAHLAAWALGRDRLPDDAPGAGGRIVPRSATAMAGVYDLSRVAGLPGGEIVQDLLGGVTPEQDPRRYALASPIEQLPIDRPVNVLHGQDDEIVPAWSIETYVQRHEETGNDGVVEVLEQTDHDAWTDVRGIPWARARQALIAELAR